MRLAGLISNLVPYHHARWQALAGSFDGEVHLVQTTARDSFKILEYSSATDRLYTLHTLFSDRAYDSLSRKEIRGALQKLLDKLQPTVLSLNGYWAIESWAALEWGMKYKVPSVVCSESNEFDAPRKPWKEFIKKLILSRCAAGLAGGNPQKQYLIRLGMPETSVFLGYDAVDNRYFEENSDAARKNDVLLRKQFGLPSRYFLAVSRFTPKKNLTGLIEAFALYCEQTGRAAAWNLVIAGDGPLRHKLEAKIKELGMEDKILLAGPCGYSDLPAFYGLAQAFVHASTTEQWGLVVNEAMASGIAVLVSNRCGCVTDLVQEGITGYSFDPRNTSQIAALLCKLSSGNVNLEAMGAKGRELINSWGPTRFAQGMNSAVAYARNAKTRAHLLSAPVISMLAKR